MAKFLTDADARLLQEMLTAFKSGHLNIPSRPSTEETWAENHQAPETYIAKPRSSDSALEANTGTGTYDYDEPGVVTCDIYRIVDIDDSSPTLQPVEFAKKVYTLSESPLNQEWITITRTKYGHWVPVGSRSGIVGIALAENHPGRGSLFDVNVGVWDPTDHSWEYDWDETEKCIDWRVVDDYPDTIATGLAAWRFSDEYGYILEVVSLDCDALGTATGDF